VLTVVEGNNLNFLTATSASLYVPLYTSALAPEPIYFSIFKSDSFNKKKSYPFWNSSSKIFEAGLLA
jgi:hypothetical protein